MKQESQNQQTTSIDRSRQLNKYIFNRIVVTIAKSGMGPFSVIFHIGRQSGRTYRTPVLASYVEDKIVIPLSYGENVDWLRNVLAQSGCEISYKNRRVGATNPIVIDSAAALAMLPEKRRRFFERFKTDRFLCLKVIKK